MKDKLVQMVSDELWPLSWQSLTETRASTLSYEVWGSLTGPPAGPCRARPPNSF